MQVLLEPQVLIRGDESIESSFLDQGQKPTILHGRPALPWHRGYRNAGKVIPHLFRNALIQDDALQG